MASAAGKRKRKTTSRFQDTGAAPAPTKKMAAEAGGSDDVTTGGAETTGTLPYRVNPEFIIELLHTPCEMLKPPDNRVFIAERTDKVVDVFKGLVQHNFLAVPVLQKTKHLWYGFLDMADIVSYIVEHFEETQLSSSEDFWNLVNTTEEFQQKTVNEIMRRIGLTRNPFHPVKRGHSLLFVMEALAREHLHRVPVVDENRNLVNLITQSQLVRFLHQNLDRIGPKVDKPVAEMEGVFHEVVSIQHDQKALEAFKLMVKEVNRNPHFQIFRSFLSLFLHLLFFFNDRN
jgi:CBS domain-containing protein